MSCTRSSASARLRHQAVRKPPQPGTAFFQLGLSNCRERLMKLRRLTGKACLAWADMCLTQCLDGLFQSFSKIFAQRKRESPPALPLSIRARYLDLSGDGGFVGALVALVVDPGDGDLVAGLGALDLEAEDRVARNRPAIWPATTVLPFECDRDGLDEDAPGTACRRCPCAGRFPSGGSSARGCRQTSPFIWARIFIGSAMLFSFSFSWMDQPPQPPTVTLTSLLGAVELAVGSWPRHGRWRSGPS